jgi:hypothetical protein
MKPAYNHYLRITGAMTGARMMMMKTATASTTDASMTTKG